MTPDHLSEGRVVIGIGASGPQVVEGWYGRPDVFARMGYRDECERIQDLVFRLINADEARHLAVDLTVVPANSDRPGMSGRLGLASAPDASTAARAVTGGPSATCGPLRRRPTRTDRDRGGGMSRTRDARAGKGGAQG